MQKLPAPVTTATSEQQLSKQPVAPSSSVNNSSSNSSSGSSSSSKLYIKQYTVLEASLTELCHFYFDTNPSKIIGLRHDYLSCMLHRLCLAPGQQLLALDHALGLPTAGALLRVGNQGKVFRLLEAGAAADRALREADLPPALLSCLVDVNIHHLMEVFQERQEGTANATAPKGPPEGPPEGPPRGPPKEAEPSEGGPEGPPKEEGPPEGPSNEAGPPRGASDSGGPPGGAPEETRPPERPPGGPPGGPPESPREKSERMQQQQQQRLRAEAAKAFEAIKAGGGLDGFVAAVSPYKVKRQKGETSFSANELFNKLLFNAILLAHNFLKPGGRLVLFTQAFEMAANVHSALCASREFVHANLEELLLREIQVIPGRTHPTMQSVISVPSGFIVSAIKINSSP
ncbi:Eukaryotic initiation factor 3 family member protein, related [Eimeria tenella]|uniref:tRNA (adenine(58)-N(1))-methyltransferase non-catalytic subunit TRM6 n=1 Tax=Eimeria tenella TaxID=5802 RepID=U6KTV6_EIMTE|nr:Eukaryotic initiation factor 3 family member protein, related [Eimeria tenella]CDJ41547.1 Eukaryotic initiation factor 3 family member protein, related [Eimeria tenella]|eukprot:XP_013232297.1 Eukaryotic initiation factor 3 family member protein, related [Eimeria tenella]